CALWDNWQKQRQIRIDTLSQHIANNKEKLLDDHDSNNSTLPHSKTGTLSIHDDRYLLLPPRI
ncbi:unnamed protein product, partial [Adineta steineri]